jgi:predicted transcriptional regulator
MLVLSLKLKDDQVRTIEIIAEKTSGGRTESALQALAAVSGLPMYVDRPRDLDLKVSYKDL